MLYPLPTNKNFNVSQTMIYGDWRARIFQFHFLFASIGTIFSRTVIIITAS